MTQNKKSVKFQGDMLIFYDFIQAYVFATNHHLNPFCMKSLELLDALKNYGFEVSLT